MIGDDLYKREYDQPLLKCVTTEQVQYIIKELHEGICGYHSGARTMKAYAIKKCIPCQKHGNLIH